MVAAYVAGFSPVKTPAKAKTITQVATIGILSVGFLKNIVSSGIKHEIMNNTITPQIIPTTPETVVINIASPTIILLI